MLLSGEFCKPKPTLIVILEAFVPTTQCAAVIEIYGTFTFNNFVQPIVLISNQNLVPETTGNQVRVSGWGWTTPNGENSSNQLQAVDVPIIENNIADQQLDLAFANLSPPRNHPELTQRMISTGAVEINRQGACHGDSGGPLVFKQNGQNDIQIGVVSWGVPRCVGGENSPSVYSRLSQLVDWVHSEIWNFVTIQDNDLVCSNTTMTYTIQKPFNFPSSITVSSWTSSNNTQIISSNNTSSEIRVLNSNSTGDGWVKAVLSNGIILQKDFSVGKPSDKNLSIITTGNGIYLFSKTWQELLGLGGENIEWKTLRTSILERNSGSNSILIYPTISCGI